MPSFTRPPDLFDYNEPPPLWDEDDAPESSEVRSAAWGMTTTAGLWDIMSEKDYQADPNFKHDWKNMDPRFYRISDELAKSESQEEWDAIQLREVKRMDKLATIGEAGPAGIAALVGAELFDPIMLPFWFIPFTGPGRAGRVANSVRASLAIGTDFAIREAVAHRQEPSRTAGDTIPILGAGMALGFGLGALARPAISKAPIKQQDRMIKELQKNYDEVEAETSGLSAATTTRVPEGTQSPYGVPAKMSEYRANTPKWVKAITPRGPAYRLTHSVDGGMAEPAAIADELIPVKTPKARDEQGLTPRYPSGRHDSWFEELSGEQHNLGAIVPTLIKEARKAVELKHGAKFSKNEMDELLERVAVYGDRSTEYDAVLPFVRELRDITDMWTAREVGVKLFDEMPAAKWNKHYGRRFYDQKKIRERPHVFISKSVRGMMAEEGEIRTVAELESRAANVVSNITSSAKMHPSDTGGGYRHFGPTSTKAITHEVKDEYIEDFLVRSASARIAHIQRDIAPIVTALERYLPYSPSGKIDDVLEYTDKGLSIKYLRKRLDDEFEARRAKALESSDTEMLTKLMRTHEQAVEDTRALINIISGANRHMGNMDRRVVTALNEVRALTSFAWLGNAGLASIHEVLKSTIEHGFSAAGRGMGVVFDPSDLARANVRQVKSLGTALDTAIGNSSALLRADVDEAVALRGMSTMASRYAGKMYQLNGQNHLNSFTKQVEAFAFMQDVIEFSLGKHKLTKGSKVYKQRIASYARNGIGVDDLQRIAREVKRGGIVDHNGTWLFDSAKMGKSGTPAILRRLETRAARAGEAGIVGLVPGSIMTFLENPVGRSLTQFKRVFFGYGDGLGQLAYRMGQGDMRAASGMMAMFGMAWMAYQVRVFLRHLGNDPETAADEFMKEWEQTAIQDHVREAIERSGLTGLFFELFSQADNMAGGGLSHAARLREGSKHYYRNASALGNLIPSLSYAEKAGKGFLSPLKEGGATQRDLQNASYIMPLRTLFYVDPIIDQLINSGGRKLPAGERRARRQRKVEEEGLIIR